MTAGNKLGKIRYPELQKNIPADVAIIGGGITGILSAHMLSKAGKKVVLIEEKELVSGATKDTTAFITKVIDSSLTEIISLFGEEAARKVWESGQAAIEEFEHVIKEEHIECEFMRCPNYIFAASEKQAEGLPTEAGRYKRLKLEAKLASKGDTSLGFPHHGYIEIPNQAKFYATPFAHELAARAVALGASVFENTKAIAIQEENGLNTVKTPKGKITARDVIVATYQPITNKRTHFKKGMYVSYLFEVEIPKSFLRVGLYEDNGNPYHYFRIDKGEEKGKYDTMIIGGEDHRREMQGKLLIKKSFKGLEKFLKKLMQDNPYKIKERWYGPILESSDGLPLIGEIRPHLYVATAFSGNGMTYSMISSMILSDLISGKKNPWAEVYSPKRSLFHPKRLAVKAKDYGEEFFRGAVKNMLSN